MAKLEVLKGTTSFTVYVFVQDSSLTTGAGLTGLVFNSASLVAYYVRPLGSATAITLATQTVTGAWSSGGFVEVSSANMPGVYRLDLPDAILATGVNSVVVMLKGAANMVPVILEIQLAAVDIQDAVRGGLTALPNAVAAAAGGLMGSTWATLIADAHLKRDMSAVVGAAARSPLNALRRLRNRNRIAAGVLSVYEEDDATVNWTAAVSTAAGNPISEIDPV